jgi:hypothetical protein
MVFSYNFCLSPSPRTLRWIIWRLTVGTTIAWSKRRGPVDSMAASSGAQLALHPTISNDRFKVEGCIECSHSDTGLQYVVGFLYSRLRCTSSGRSQLSSTFTFAFCFAATIFLFALAIDNDLQKLGCNQPIFTIFHAWP